MRKGTRPKLFVLDWQCCASLSRPDGLSPTVCSPPGPPKTKPCPTPFLVPPAEGLRILPLPMDMDGDAAGGDKGNFKKYFVVL